MTEYFIGIDPGASNLKGHGAGVVILNGDGKPVNTFHAPTKKYSVGKSGKPRIAVDTNKLYEKLISSMFILPDFIMATMEHPTPLPKTFDVPVKATCELFMHYGAINSVLELFCDRVFPVHPMSWKKGFKLGKEKTASLQLARSMFPGVDLRNKQDHNIGEALIIAEYGRLIHKGEK